MEKRYINFWNHVSQIIVFIIKIIFEQTVNWSIGFQFCIQRLLQKHFWVFQRERRVH